MSGRRILVVDDDAAIRETLERVLRGWRYDVIAAASAEEALGVLQRVDPAVMITDVRMSGMDGLELLRLVRERAPEVDVIVITAFEDMRTAIDAMKVGAYEYLVKPLDLDRIEMVVQRCFADRTARRRTSQMIADAREEFSLDRIAGRDSRMIEIYKIIGQLSGTRTPVLIRGETGTGKELIARAIHFNSTDAAEPFVAVNCTAIPESLLESELFGHKRGAFTGATSDRRGRFALAGRGTVFLDEIGDTSGAFQAKLLRVLQEHEFLPVGSESAERTEARVIAATHRDLESLVRAGMFREDLYFRLRVVEVRVPALRERRGDIPVLAEHFIAKIARSLHRLPPVLTPAALERASSYDWPGNVRELENTITRALVLGHGGVIDAGDLALTEGAGAAAAAAAHSRAASVTLADIEREHVMRVLDRTRGNKRKAARLLGISRARLDRLIARHGLGAPDAFASGEEGTVSRPVRRKSGLESTHADE